METRDMNTMGSSMASTSQYHQIPIQIQNQNPLPSQQIQPQQQQQYHPPDHVTTHNGTTTFHTTVGAFFKKQEKLLQLPTT